MPVLPPTLYPRRYDLCPNSPNSSITPLFAKHHLNMFFTGVSPKPDSQAEYNHQYRKAGDIKSFNECFGAGLGVLQWVETLLFATHDRNVFPTV